MAAKPMAAPGAPPRDFATALEEMDPNEAEPDMDSDDSGLNPEQASLAEAMGMSSSEAAALKQFIETCKKY